MGEHKATFEIESKTDAYAVERLIDRLYDTLREESRMVREGSSDSTEMLEQFDQIRSAAHQRKPAKLTVVYEHRDEEFE